MNVYFSHMQQDIKKVDWSKVVGLSNYELALQETYHFHKLFLKESKLDIAMCHIKFYKKRNCAEVAFEMDIPVKTGSIYLQNIGQLHFPKTLLSYEFLQTLKLDSCHISKFPWMQLPKKLSTLSLANNLLAGNVNLSHTNGLRFINLSHNHISSLHLPYDCNTADISHNDCTDIIFYNPMMHCDFSWNKLVDFTACKWLETCDISHNLITACDFKPAKKMTIIDVSFNEIHGEIDVTNLVQLEKLNLSNNSITWVEGLDSLPNLENFDASSNCIETATVPKIHRVSLSYNPLRYFEWLDRKKSGAFSLSGFLNGEKHDIPFVNMMLGVVKSHLRADDIDRLYEKNSAPAAEPKLFIDLSFTKLEEFSDIAEVPDRSTVHVTFYGNEYVDIPFHPQLCIHIDNTQIKKWIQEQEPETRIKITQLKNQQFYVVRKISKDQE